MAVSGLLSTLSRKNSNPLAPANIIADFCGGGLIAVIGILLALKDREKTNQGQVIDVSMSESVSFISTFIFKMKQIGAWNNPSGENLLDSGAPFYDTYETLDGKYMAVGAIESKFYKCFIDGLGIKQDIPAQMDIESWPKLKAIFAARFLEKTRSEWTDIFLNLDACVTPVLEMEVDDLMSYPQNKFRELLKKDVEGNFDPKPVPRMSRTRSVGYEDGKMPIVGEHSVIVLRENGIGEDVINLLLREGIVFDALVKNSKL